MSKDSESFAEDFYLHVPQNPRIIAKKERVEESHGSSKPLRVEMQTLRLSGESQNLILETLRFIHGPDFELKKASAYKDKKGTGHANRYWLERGNLVVSGVFDYSKKRSELSTNEDKFRMFALNKLESYGFHKAHCAEALDYTNGQIDAALYLLYCKYYDIDDSVDITCDSTDNELLDYKIDEKAVLESMYESAFKEKEANLQWEITLNLQYIIKLYENKEAKIASQRKENVNYNNKNNNFKTKPSNICRNFSQGSCKFGNKCRFSHQMPAEPLKEVCDTTSTNNEFVLEIRFPPNSKYPFESPYIFVKSNAPSGSLPPLTCLHVCRRLIEEANLLSQDGIPSVYSIIDLLQNEEAMTTFLKENTKQFIEGYVPLYPIIIDEEEKTIKILPSHYEKASNRDNRLNLDMESVCKEDDLLAKKFLEKQSNGQYKKMLEGRKQLPAWSKMKDILSTIDKSQIMVICGETGCGKSTQVPQFILDEWLLNRAKSRVDSHVEIVCTQPRRISAIGVADRVADERVEKCGNSVGYSIRLETKVSSKTRLTFCTTGILLRRLESDPKLNSVTHVIVDEVHERSEESDFLLLILKDILASRKDLKVILMSATMNAKLFSDYFGDIPILEIPGRTFPVERLFLEDILDMSTFVMEQNSKYTRKLKKGSFDDLEIEMSTCDVMAPNSLPKANIRDENLTLTQTLARYNGYSNTTCKNLYLMDPEKIHLDLIEHILTYIVQGDHDWPKDGAILVFLPGISEITSLHDQLCDNQIFSPRTGNFVLVPLHSTLTSEEQIAVFQKTKKGVRKIVISTNIAETSVTIDDCVFVVDSGKMKEKRFDSNRNMESLEMIWVSKANAQQRSGRAGRVMPGVCIHLFTGHRFEHHFLHQPIPELHRVPLEQLILRIKTLQLFEGVDVHKVLGGTIEPPLEENITSALSRLKDVGALDLALDLTALGAHLAALPVDVRIGKLMLFGAIFCCLDSALTIAACLSYKSPFVAPFGKKDAADAKKKEFAVNNSDQLTVLKAYKKWQESVAHSRYAGQNFASLNYLSGKTLSMLGDIKHQLLDLLGSIGFVPALSNSRRGRGLDRVAEITGPELNANGDNQKLLAAILCAALYPNVVKVLTPEKSFHQSAGGAVPRQPRPEELRFKTKQDGYVCVHPTSVNYTVSHFASPYMVYQEKVKTSRIFIRDCSMVPLLPFVLFSGCHLGVELQNGSFVVSLEDGWIVFQVETCQVAEMLKTIRSDLINLLEEKIKDPCLNLLHHDKGNKIIKTILQVITKD